MHNILYKGPFKDHIQNYIELKQAVGYKCDGLAHGLRRFDQFTLERYPEVNTLTKEIVLDWCSKKAYEAQANQCLRTSIVRQFGKYLDSIGLNAYVIPIIKNIYQESCAHFLVVRETIKSFDVAKSFHAWQQALRIS